MPTNPPSTRLTGPWIDLVRRTSEIKVAAAGRRVRRIRAPRGGLLEPEGFRHDSEVDMNSGPTVKKGSTGEDVRRLQRILVMIKELDYTGIDGIFGANTEAAVKSFQQGAGLAVDGVAGPNTWGKLPPDPHTPLLQSGPPDLTSIACKAACTRTPAAGRAPT